jgi:hypothetical protein
VLAYRTHDALLSMLRAKQLRRAHDMLPASWCSVINVHWTDNADSADVGYHQEAEWDREYKPGRHDWPSRRYDVLTVTLPTGKMPSVSTDTKEITVGPWTYRKGRGHTLSVIYHLQGPEQDAAAFLAENNSERRCAIINACGEDLSDLLVVEEIQRDDFGRLCHIYLPRDACSAKKWAEWQITPHDTTRRDAINYFLIHLAVFVRVVCPSTSRIYWLQVPDTCTTAREAVAATFGLTATEYQPITQS